MSLLQLVTDRYNRKARFTPAVLVVLPVIVYAIFAVPVLVTIWSKIAVLATFCLPFVVSQVVRDRGLRIQPVLFEKWGGRPSDALLRWRSGEAQTVIARRHQLVRKHLDIELPDKATEIVDPAEADAVYAMATDALRERTRDQKKFPLVFEENITYGFRRNAYACRVPAWVVCGLAVAATLVLARWSLVPLGWKQQTGLIAFDVLAAIGWWNWSTSDAVRRAADKYARQLFVSLETLSTEPTPPQPEAA
ncbi:hypothetical protein [Micromonospora sp. LOL_021]|uniref:hypothetical protein n=1 Tax=Micromonospora sp. LOL_021 TaxID=3345417 RepID=UPI003A84455F